MKYFNNYILQEKLKINKDTKINTLYRFEHIDKKDHECFWGYNWILNYSYYNVCIQLVEWVQNNCSLNTNEETFVEKFLEDLIDYKHSLSSVVQTRVLNGDINNGFYKRPKFIYDTCKLIKDNNIKYLKDNQGNKINNDEIDNIIFDLENITNGDIKKLDWPH